MSLAELPDPIQMGSPPPSRSPSSGRGAPPQGGELVPLVFESGGRPSDEAVAFFRSYGHGLPMGERSEVLGTLWRRLSRTLHMGTADMVLSALV